MVISITFLTCLFLLMIACEGHKEPSSRSTCDQTTYDYIIIGAGSAGSVVAGELATNLPNKQILLIEEGYFSNLNQNIDDMSKYSDVVADITVARVYDTTPQTMFDNTRLELLMAKVTGGANAHNGQVWMLGNENDFSDKWDNIENWSLDDIIPIFNEIEVKGFHNGVLSASDPIINKFIEAGMAVGYEFNPNYNDLDGLNGTQATQEGIGPFRYQLEFVYNENNDTYYLKRHTSYTDWIDPILQDSTMNNLNVVTNTRAQRLLFGKKKKHKHKIVGVETYNIGKYKNITYYANEEVIVSCGTYETPKLLLLSGIGDCDELVNEYGVDCEVDLPGVGRNLKSHVGFSFIMPPFYNNSLLLKSSFIKMNQFIWWGAVALSEKGEQQIVLTVTQIEENSGDPSQSVFAINGYAGLNSLQATGQVKLKDNNPNSEPIIIQYFLNNSNDQQLAIDAIKQVRTIVYDSGVFDDIMLDETYEITPGYAYQTDEEILQAITDASLGMFFDAHPVGTCKMGNYSSDDEYVVVDPSLKVRNIENLRVIDASIMPKTPNANTNVMSMVIGLKGAKMIIQDCLDTMEPNRRKHGKY